VRARSLAGVPKSACERAGLRRGFDVTDFVNQMRGDGAIDDAQHVERIDAIVENRFLGKFAKVLRTRKTWRKSIPVLAP